MKLRKKKKETIEVIEDEKTETKEKKTGIKSTIFLIISIILLLSAGATFAYLYHENQKLEKEIASSKESIKKVEENIKNDQQEITEKEDEYEKLKEKVKDSLEELNVWNELKDELNKELNKS